MKINKLQIPFTLGYSKVVFLEVMKGREKTKPSVSGKLKERQRKAAKHLSKKQREKEAAELLSCKDL